MGVLPSQNIGNNNRVSAFFSDLDTLAGGIILGIAFFSNALEPDQNS
jgi:hypothetical protein